MDKDFNKYFNNKWRFIDHTKLGLDWSALHSFAYDDTICHSVGKEAMPSTLRAWVHSKTIVLGTQDSRLPKIEDGLSYLNHQEYDVIVRNSGGLAVVLDDQILNISLILKEDKGFSINRGYDLMLQLITEMFPHVEIKAGEIVGSYCPGSYDLSIGGKKFAGISQRRIRNGIAIQIYLCISGSGSNRARLIQSFYSKAVQGLKANFDYPIIEPSTMASLEELLNDSSLTVQNVLHRAYQVLERLGAEFVNTGLSEDEKVAFSNHLEKVSIRNEKCLP
ncbi:biotin/lipoate A/B protein ligase family protein [Alkalihalobacillus trypoxylicola]|uniref:Octanoyl-[GcvH]:protein N-octanoyltransferase n=1 Tax=Alkalihalobacillus trypoxylicola TaxID=519424 RepID=A0A162DHU5_9BACI|nr:biotin/lipoate A/B protein ligase family protein [Alkalihalobacillus trypoxylicola]KYG29676.1 octanoyltransferase [Alkalihalobacillus trypoxylicola]